MSVRQLIIIVIVTFMLALGQLFAKLAVIKIDLNIKQFSDVFRILFSMITSINVWFSILSTGVAIILWLGILKSLQLNMVYPLISLSYIFGLFMAYFFLGEVITFSKLFGVFLIILGVFFVANG